MASNPSVSIDLLLGQNQLEKGLERTFDALAPLEGRIEGVGDKLAAAFSSPAGEARKMQQAIEAASRGAGEQAQAIAAAQKAMIGAANAAKAQAAEAKRAHREAMRDIRERELAAKESARDDREIIEALKRDEKQRHEQEMAHIRARVDEVRRLKREELSKIDAMAAAAGKLPAGVVRTKAEEQVKQERKRVNTNFNIGDAQAVARELAAKERQRHRESLAGLDEMDEGGASTVFARMRFEEKKRHDETMDNIARERSARIEAAHAALAAAVQTTDRGRELAAQLQEALQKELSAGVKLWEFQGGRGKDLADEARAAEERAEAARKAADAQAQHISDIRAAEARRHDEAMANMRAELAAAQATLAGASEVLRASESWKNESAARAAMIAGLPMPQVGDDDGAGGVLDEAGATAATEARIAAMAAAAADKEAAEAGYAERVKAVETLAARERALMASIAQEEQDYQDETSRERIEQLRAEQAIAIAHLEERRQAQMAAARQAELDLAEQMDWDGPSNEAAENAARQNMQAAMAETEGKLAEAHARQAELDRRLAASRAMDHEEQVARELADASRVAEEEMHRAAEVHAFQTLLMEKEVAQAAQASQQIAAELQAEMSRAVRVTEADIRQTIERVRQQVAAGIISREQGLDELRPLQAGLSERLASPDASQMTRGELREHILLQREINDLESDKAGNERLAEWIALANQRIRAGQAGADSMRQMVEQELDTTNQMIAAGNNEVALLERRAVLEKGLGLLTASTAEKNGQALDGLMTRIKAIETAFASGKMSRQTAAFNLSMIQDPSSRIDAAAAGSVPGDPLRLQYVKDEITLVSRLNEAYRKLGMTRGASPLPDPTTAEGAPRLQVRRGVGDALSYGSSEYIPVAADLRTQLQDTVASRGYGEDLGKAELDTIQAIRAARRQLATEAARDLDEELMAARQKLAAGLDAANAEGNSRRQKRAATEAAIAGYDQERAAILEVVDALEKEGVQLGAVANSARRKSREVANAYDGDGGFAERGANQSGAVQLGTATGYMLNDAQMFFMSDKWDVRIRQGFQAISNNLDQFTNGWRAAMDDARQRGVGMGKALLGVLTGTGGILIAVNLIATGITVWPKLMQSMRTETEKLAYGMKTLWKEMDEQRAKAAAEAFKGALGGSDTDMRRLTELRQTYAVLDTEAKALAATATEFDDKIKELKESASNLASTGLYELASDARSEAKALDEQLISIRNRLTELRSTDKDGKIDGGLLVTMREEAMALEQALWAQVQLRATMTGVANEQQKMDELKHNVEMTKLRMDANKDSVEAMRTHHLALRALRLFEIEQQSKDEQARLDMLRGWRARELDIMNNPLMSPEQRDVSRRNYGALGSMAAFTNSRIGALTTARTDITAISEEQIEQNARAIRDRLAAQARRDTSAADRARREKERLDREREDREQALRAEENRRIELEIENSGESDASIRSRAAQELKRIKDDQTKAYEDLKGTDPEKAAFKAEQARVYAQEEIRVTRERDTALRELGNKRMSATAESAAAERELQRTRIDGIESDAAIELAVTLDYGDRLAAVAAEYRETMLRYSTETDANVRHDLFQLAEHLKSREALLIENRDRETMLARQRVEDRRKEYDYEVSERERQASLEARENALALRGLPVTGKGLFGFRRRPAESLESEIIDNTANDARTNLLREQQLAERALRDRAQRENYAESERHMAELNALRADYARRGLNIDEKARIDKVRLQQEWDQYDKDFMWNSATESTAMMSAAWDTHFQSWQEERVKALRKSGLSEEAATKQMQKEGKTRFAISKALAMGETVVSTYAAAQKAYHAELNHGNPKTRMPRAIAAAAISVAGGLVRLNEIRKSTMDGGGGGGGGGGSEGMGAQGGSSGGSAAGAVPQAPSMSVGGVPTPGIGIGRASSPMQADALITREITRGIERGLSDLKASQSEMMAVYADRPIRVSRETQAGFVQEGQAYQLSRER